MPEIDVAHCRREIAADDVTLIGDRHHAVEAQYLREVGAGYLNIVQIGAVDVERAIVVVDEGDALVAASVDEGKAVILIDDGQARRGVVQEVCGAEIERWKDRGGGLRVP